MQKLLTSTALVFALAAPMTGAALADTQAQAEAQAETTMDTKAAPQFGTAATEGAPQDVMASDLIGARLYTAENGVADDQVGQNTDWNDVGEIHDIVLNKDGAVDYVIADIGGFLGIGEKQVAVSMSDLKFVSDGADSNDWFIVLPATKAQLEGAPSYDSDLDHAMRETGAAVTQAADATGEAMERTGDEIAEAASQAATATGNAAEKASDEMAAATEQLTDEAHAEAGKIESQPTQAADMTAEELTGQRVYDANGEWIGEVDEVLLAQDGSMTGQAVIDVGGFLGMGEKPVAISLTDLSVKHDENGDDMQLHVNATKEQLEEMPTYEAS